MRLNKTIEIMKEEGMDQLLISDPISINYLTGISVSPGERLYALLISGNRKVLFINKLFPKEAVEGIEFTWLDDTDDQIGILACYLEGNTIGVDKNFPAGFLLPLMEKYSGEFKLGSYIVDNMRRIKDSSEQVKMEEASKLNDRAMDLIKKKIVGSITEVGLTDELKKIYSDLGSDKFSFDPIFGFGKNAADPHHENDNSTLVEGDSIIIDMGCILDEYCSDMTRTFFYKSVSEKAREVYDVVLRANLAGIAAVKPGVKFSEIDRATRNVIEEAGYGEYFTHRTGHSIGLETHEPGDVSSSNDEVIMAGNIFSIEPGIYIPGEFGVRIEDLVLVTEDGCKVLNSYSKELEILNE